MNTIDVEKEKSYQVIYMDRPKVNAINQEMITELTQAIKAAKDDDVCQGVILTGRHGIFSAGLDLIELYDYNEEQIEHFLRSFSQLHYDLVAFSKVLIMGVNGHSPAGGTVIALGGDCRIMAEGDKYRIGLNEVSVNVQISTMLIESYSFWLGRGVAYRHILAGELLAPQLALQEGLVDMVVPKEEVLLACKKRMNNYLQSDPNIFSNTKKKLRKGWIDKIAEIDNTTDLEQAVKVWWSPEVRKKMQMFIYMLKNKNK